MAMPWNVEIKPTGRVTPSPTGSVTPNPPKPSTTIGAQGPKPPVNNGTLTTETITKTTFVPTSSPIAIPGGTTKYSTWLTTQTYLTTTCYTVPPAAPTPSTKTVPSAEPTVITKTVLPPAPPAVTSCPAPVTVTVTITSQPTGTDVYYTPGGAPHNCDLCQTITYTNISGGVETIIIPAPTTSPAPPASETKTTKSETVVKPTKTPTPPYGSGSTSIPNGTGKPAPVPTGSQVPSGTGRLPPKPTGW